MGILINPLTETLINLLTARKASNQAAISSILHGEIKRTRIMTGVWHCNDLASMPLTEIHKQACLHLVVRGQWLGHDLW
jgi:hypothetical protein